MGLLILGRLIVGEGSTQARVTLVNPIGLVLLGVSALLAIGVASRGVPIAAVALVAWGLLAYSAMVTIDRQRRHDPVPPPAPPDYQPVPPKPDPIPPPLPEPKEFEKLVEHALRNLSRPTVLSKSLLIDELRCTLAQARTRRLGVSAEPTPLVQAQLLREVVIAGIDRLKPIDAPGVEKQVLVYRILHDQYVLGLPTRAIWMKQSIGESTLHRWRGDGVEALADELRRQELALRDGRSGFRNPVALDYLG
jgi:hypothetical protein